VPRAARSAAAARRLPRNTLAAAASSLLPATHAPAPAARRQVDNETYGTSTRKFLTAVPLVLFVLATHGTDFRKQPLGLNLLVVLVLLIAKLPYLHRVRFFGIGA
jgi:hypothetical protein